MNRACPRRLVPAVCLAWVLLAGPGQAQRHHFTCYSVEHGLAGSQVYSLLQDDRGYLWAGTAGGGVSRFDGTAFHTFDRQGGLAGSLVRSLLEDRRGDIWIGTAMGVSRFDGERLRPLEALGETVVYALLEDRQGRIWIGTGSGAVRYDGATLDRVAEIDVPVAGFAVKSLLEDRAGNIWLGTDGAGVLIYDGSSVETLTERGGLASNSVWSILEDREGNVWLGTYRGGICKYGGGRFAYYGKSEGLGGEVVRAIVEDRDGNLWFGTYRGGVSKYDGESFNRFTTADGLVHDFVLTIMEDRRGDMWFGTFRGVSRYDGTTFTNYTPADGLAGYLVRSLLEDRHGKVWIGTNAGGLSIYDGSSFESLTTEDGLNHDSVMAIVEDGAGDVWIGTLGGVNRFDGQRLIDVSSAFGLGPLAPAKVGYRYRLEGFDDDVSPVTRDRHATYSNLAPGRYVFSVEAGNGDGVWGRSPAVELTIVPPVWQTWWFRALALAAILGGAVALHDARIRRAKALATELERQVKERTAEISRQKQEIEGKNAELERFVFTVSHDLKSPLITIRGFLGMLEKDAAAGDAARMRSDVERIRAASGKMARLLDELLELSRIGRITNDPERVSLGDVAREAVEQVAGEIAERGAEIVIAPDLPAVLGDRQRLLEVLQNLIANAVRYMGDQGRPEVEIGARGDGMETVFFVRDNGIGIDPRYHQKIFGLFERLQPETEGTGVGLALVKRIVEVHGGRAWVESEGAGLGATFCFTLPGQESLGT